MIFFDNLKLYVLFVLCVFVCSTTHALRFDYFKQSFPLEISKGGAKVICSSVAIHPQIILTAAHCVEGAERIALVKGFDLDQGHPRYMAQSWEAHPNYNREKSNYHYDVAKVILSNPLPENLPYTKVGWPIEGRSIVRVGFGGRNSKNARTLISGQDLIYMGDDYFELNDEYGVMGDSGGPVFQMQNGSYVLVGIHSTKEGKNKTYAVHPYFRF